MFTLGLFRERAILRQSNPDPLDDLLRITAPHEWLILTGFLIAFAAACVWLAFGSLERSMTANGFILRSGERHTILSGTTGTVSEILVRVNDEVAEGQPIARLRLPELDTQLTVLRKRIALLEREASQDGPGTNFDGGLLAVARQELVGLLAHRAASAIVAPYSGVVSAFHLHVGQAVDVGTPVSDLRRGGDDGLEILAFLPPARAQKLRKSMRARVIIDNLRNQQSVPAEVKTVAPRASLPPAWLSRIALAEGERKERMPLHMVRLIMLGQPNTVPSDAAPCRIHIILETVSPLALLANTGPSSR